MKFTLSIRSCLLALLGSMILAFGLYNIHSFSGVTEGGIPGLVLLLDHHLHISPAISSLILNAVCYVIGWRFLGRDFIGYSLFASGGFSLFYALFEKFPPLFPQIAEHPLLAAIVGAIFVGISVGICVRAGGAPCGDDALAMAFSRISHIDIKWIYLVSDLSVLLLSLTYIPIQRIAFSLISVVISGQLVGLVQKIRFADSGKTPDTTNASRDVLCATLRDKEQLDVCLQKKFYHIPANRLNPSDFPIRYIALYQSRYKFEARAGIIYYGEIEKYALVKRRDITEIPRASRELYYRFEIKEWKKLPRPIVPDTEDLTKLKTSYFLLTNAEKVSELCFGSEAEFEAYRKIGKLISGELSEIPCSTENRVVKCEGGSLVFYRDDKAYFSASVEDYKKNPLSTFRYISGEL